MIGLGSSSEPIRTRRSIVTPGLIPNNSSAVEDRSADARADEVRRLVAVAHRNHAAVTAAETTAHDAFDRHLRRPAMAGREYGDRGEHRFRPAGVDGGGGGGARIG